MSAVGRCVGIDLGTTRSAVAVVEDGRPVLLHDRAWGRLLPSALAVTPDGEVLLGHDALRAASAWPERAATSVKRLMGRRFSELGGLPSALPYRVEADPADNPEVVLGERRWSPPEISAQFLAALRRCAEEGLGEEVAEAVIAVPAYFNDDQRKATRDAAALAGLKVRRLLHEPTAAALAFRVAQGFVGKVAVYDFGGGTFDVSVLHFTQAGVQVLAVNGDPSLGGDDLTRALVAWAVPKLRVPQPAPPLLARLLWEQAEGARVALSSQPRAALRLPAVGDFAGGELDVERVQLDALLAPFVARTLDLCRQALHDADLDPRHVEHVLLVGGVTHTPLIRAKLEHFFGRAPRADIDPEEAVALGAAVFAAQDHHAGWLRDVTPLSLGVEVEGGLMDRLIPRNALVPTSRAAFFTTTRDGQTELQVKVFQGERALARDNRFLGELVLGPLPPAPKGTPKVEVTFSLDQDALLSVEARDTRTQQRHHAHIEARQGLTPQALQRLLDEATQARALDDETRALASAVAELRQSLDDLRATLDDRDIPLSEGQRRQLRHLISQGDEALAKPTPSGVQAALTALTQAR